MQRGIKVTNCSSTAPQVVSFFHRAMLTVGLAVLSLWPMLSGLFDKAKVGFGRDIVYVCLFDHKASLQNVDVGSGYTVHSSKGSVSGFLFMSLCDHSRFLVLLSELVSGLPLFGRFPPDACGGKRAQHKSGVSI